MQNVNETNNIWPCDETSHNTFYRSQSTLFALKPLLNIPGLCIFHVEFDGAIYFYISEEIKKLQPINMNFDPKRDSSTRYYDVIETFFGEF